MLVTLATPRFGPFAGAPVALRLPSVCRSQTDAVGVGATAWDVAALDRALAIAERVEQVASAGWLDADVAAGLETAMTELGIRHVVDSGTMRAYYTPRVLSPRPHIPPTFRTLSPESQGAVPPAPLHRAPGCQSMPGKSAKAPRLVLGARVVELLLFCLQPVLTTHHFATCDHLLNRRVRWRRDGAAAPRAAAAGEPVHRRANAGGSAAAVHRGLPGRPVLGDRARDRRGQGCLGCGVGYARNLGRRDRKHTRCGRPSRCARICDFSFFLFFWTRNPP